MTATLYGSRVTKPWHPRPDDPLSVNAVAAMLGQTSDYVRTLIYSGKLPAELDERTKNYVVDRKVAEKYRAGRLKADPGPMFAELGDYAERIAAAEQVVKDLIAERNRRLVYWVDERKESVTAAAEALRLTRKRATDLLNLTRAKLEVEAAERDQQ